MFTNLMYVNLIVSDQDKALAFYSRLGFEKRIDAPGPNGRFLTLGLRGQDVELFVEQRAVASSAAVAETASGPNSGLLFIESATLKEDCQVLAAGGVTFKTGAQDYPYGVMATVLDPDGNLVEPRQRR